MNQINQEMLDKNKLPREITEEIENFSLSPLACKSINSKGRQHAEEPCKVRTVFQRDRDRIIHCSAFRRLKHKTQVFLIPKSDHYRTRLTHTLEVAQIARTIARALRLNEDLTEAIALGHDLGHTPFGHDGERTLDSLYRGGFKHYEQGLRVVDIIEREGQGLNLTIEVRDGILCHTNKIAATLEGNVVRLSDKIAYINHDIEDAIRGNVLNESDLPESAIEVLGDTKSKRITSLINSILAQSNGKNEIKYDDITQKAHDELRKFMFERVYLLPETNTEKQKACCVIQYLYHYFCENPQKMPELYVQLASDFEKERAVCDFIAGMSDDYAVDLYKDLTIPKSWK